MVSKVLFLIGLTFLGSSAGLFIILSYLSPLPERSSQKIPLPPSNCYCRGSGGPPPTITPTSPSTPTPDLSNIPEVGDVPIDVLTVEGEWPSQLDINSSDNVTVLIATPGFIGDPNLLTPSYTVNREVTTAQPLAAGISKNKVITTPIKNMFAGFEAFAVANLATTGFNVQALEPVEQTVNQPFIEWIWNIEPKALDKQIINLEIEFLWKPMDVNKENVVRQIWQTRAVVDVFESFISKGQVSLGVIASGILGSSTLFASLFSWFGEQIKKKREESKGSKKTDKKQERVKNLIQEHIEAKGRKRRRRKTHQIKLRSSDWLTTRITTISKLLSARLVQALTKVLDYIIAHLSH